nr:MAG TPA: hypothetical protein [Caudoviricetes sp.]
MRLWLVPESLKMWRRLLQRFSISNCEVEA